MTGIFATIFSGSNILLKFVLLGVRLFASGIWLSGMIPKEDSLAVCP